MTWHSLRNIERNDGFFSSNGDVNDTLDTAHVVSSTHKLTFQCVQLTASYRIVSNWPKSLFTWNLFEISPDQNVNHWLCVRSVVFGCIFIPLKHFGYNRMRRRALDNKIETRTWNTSSTSLRALTSTSERNKNSYSHTTRAKKKQHKSQLQHSNTVKAFEV